MAGMTWDMITDGPLAGTVIQPLQYTTDEDQATRVKVWVDMATPAGTYVYKIDGLDHDLLLAPTTTDEDRQEEVRARLLANERVDEVTEVTVVYSSEDGLPTVTIGAEYTTITGATQTVGFAL